MTIGRKLMLSFLAVALLIGLLGGIAFYRSMESTEYAAQHESMSVARTIGVLVSEYVVAPAPLKASAQAELQEHIMRLKELHQRDIVIVDLNKRILADAVPGEIGTVFRHDKNNEVGKTLADGRIRTFTERSAAYPQGIRQIIVPLESDNGKRIGAIVLEYTPLYQEILAKTRRDAAVFLLLYFFACSISIFIGYRISRSISRPLGALQGAALKVASGDLSVVVPPGSQNELGFLAESFNTMTKALAWSREQQKRVNEELLAEIKLRKMADAALCASEEKFRSLFENSTDGLFLLDMQGNFLDLNRTAYTRLGYTKEEMLAMHISQLNAPEFNLILKERLSRIRTEGQAVFESGHRRKDGSVMPVEVNSRILEYDGKSVFFSVIRDITERKRIDAELRNMNSRLRALIQAIPDMVIFKDVGGRHLLVNRTVEELSGHSAAEIIGKTAEELMPPGPAAACRNSDEAAMARRIPIHTEEQLIAQDGSLVYIDMVKTAMVDERDNVIGLVAVGRDVTDRRRAEEVLRKSEEKYRELVESVNSIVLRWTSDGNISFINSYGARFFGYAPGELVGSPTLGTIVPESESTGRDLAAMIQDICRFPEQYLNNVNENIRKNGRRVWISWTNKPVLSDDGQLVEILSIGNDITDRMQTQDELRRHREDLLKLVEERTRELLEANDMLRREIADRERMEQELIKAQKLESLGVLAGGIAHDFNNLLTSILGNVSVALMDVDASRPAYQELARAERATLRAQELTQQLLTFSKGGAPVKKAASIADLIRETASFALHGGRVKCEVRLPDDLRLVDIDAGQMSQVIHNLVINADHAMPDGGTISVVGENIELPCAGGPVLSPGPYVKISIRDRGIGIPAEHLPKIFDPYFTTKQRGSGLGLATSYSIIQKHGGSITVASELSKGTTFDLYLPASSACEVRIRQEETRLQFASGRILIMDDEEDVRETAGSALRRLGYAVAFAEDGGRAVELYHAAKEAGNPYDVVIMDLTVPGGMGGQETLARLREIDSSVKAIVSSGYSNDPVMANYRDYGFAGMVAKPYRIRDLGGVVHQVLAGGRSEKNSGADGTA